MPPSLWAVFFCNTNRPCRGCGVGFSYISCHRAGFSQISCHRIRFRQFFELRPRFLDRFYAAEPYSAVFFRGSGPSFMRMILPFHAFDCRHNAHYVAFFVCMRRNDAGESCHSGMSVFSHKSSFSGLRIFPRLSRMPSWVSQVTMV